MINTTTASCSQNQEKYLTSNEVSAEFIKLSTVDKKEILNVANDMMMKKNNNRSKFDCIAMAMGYIKLDNVDETQFKKA